MILDNRFDTAVSSLVALYDAATGEPFGRPKDLIYVDTSAGIYRLLARDDEGRVIRDDAGEAVYTEHSRRLRVEPHPDLDPGVRETLAGWLARLDREGVPTFEDSPPESLEDAMHEVAVEDACAELGLGEADVDFVLDSHRFNSDLLRTILEHGGDHRCYVECKLTTLAILNGRPEPTFPPRRAG